MSYRTIETAKLFLPVAYEVADGLAVGMLFPETQFERMSVPAVSAVIAVQLLDPAQSQPGSAAHCERLLAKLVETGAAINAQEGEGAFQKSLISRFDPDAFSRAFDDLASKGIFFIDKDDLDGADFLAETGAWDFTFTRRYAQQLNPIVEVDNVTKAPVTEAQHRALISLSTQIDEHLHIEALAGTGKTHLITALVERLSRFKPLVLAQTKHQLEAVMRRITAPDVQRMTIGDFATSLLQANFVLPRRLHAENDNPPIQRPHDSQIARALAVWPVAGMEPPQVVSVAWNTVARYCSSGDVFIASKHIPRTGIALNEMDEAIIVKLAMEIWELAINPSDHQVLRLPLYYYHRIKLLSLIDQAYMPENITHIIIDEAHDIPQPLYNYLGRTHVAVITLGDAFQQLDGTRSYAAPNVRKRTVEQSVRAGRQIERAVNSVIEHHPLIKSETMRGNPMVETQLKFYDNLEIPPEPTLILVANEWGLLEYCQRLAALKAPYRLLPSAEEAFKYFAKDVIRLFHDGRRGRHLLLMRYESWDQLANSKVGNDPAFKRIERLLQRGYGLDDLERLLSDQAEQQQAHYRVGRVSDAKNMEADSVMLTPDLLVESRGTRQIIARRFAAVYTGVTRAKHRLYLPGHLQDWTIDQQKAAAQDKGKS